MSTKRERDAFEALLVTWQLYLDGEVDEVSVASALRGLGETMGTMR